MLSYFIPEKSNIFLNENLYITTTIGFIIILPNLIWQVNNDFPVFQHLKELSQTQLVNVKRTYFLFEQLYFFPGSLLVIVFGLVAFFKFDTFRNYRVLFNTFIFTLAIFTYLKAKNYYSIGLYLL